MLPYRLNQIIHSYVPIGMVLWLLSWFIPLFDQTERIILFAAFVVVPLTLFRIFESVSAKPVLFIKMLIILIPIGALALAASFSLSPGRVAGLLSIPWGIVTFVIAAWGFVFLVKNTSNVGNVSKAVGFIYISVGGIWLVPHQFALPLLGFDGQIMLLTVNHFHYAGFVAPVLFGFLYDRKPNWFLPRVVVVLGGFAPILIAVGMTYSSIFEWLSVLVFASSLLLYSVLVFIHVIPNSKRWTKVFHILSSGVIWITMTLAVTYGYGQWIGQPTIPISRMILFHGWGNAVLFSFLGLLAWHATLMDQEAARIPLSRIQGKGKIGANIFANLGMIDHNPRKLATGLIDDVKVYKNEHFNPKLFHEDIIDFYEHTGDYELLIKPYWSPAFKLPAKFYKIISQWLEQMNFPLKEETNEELVESRILPILDKKDGRDHVRAWVRTYTHTNKAIYAALYSSHMNDGMRYMNIAFPLPFSQMTSILRLGHGSDGALELTSWLNSNEQTPGDQGVYVAFNQQAIRMPINETIVVWKEPGSPPGRIDAKHDMWLFGMKFLTLDYHIFKVSQGK